MFSLVETGGGPALAHPIAGGAVLVALAVAALALTRGPAVVHRRGARLALRLLAALALGVAVAGPSLPLAAPPLHVELLDASASFRPRRAGAEVLLRAARERAAALGVRTERLAFADGTGARASPDATDVAGGIAAALSLGATEILLASDGLATTPGAHEEAARAALLGVPIHAALPDRTPGPDLAIATVRAPERTRPGGRIEVEVDVAYEGAGPIEARVLASLVGASGTASSAASLTLPEGGGRATASLSLAAPEAPGLAEVAIRLEPRLEDDLVPEDESARPAVLAEPPSRVLVVAGEEAARRLAREGPLGALVAGAPRVAPSLLVGEEAALAAYDAVVLVDASADELGTSVMEACARYVDQGGALLALGARGAFGAGGYAGTALEKILPVLSSPPRRDERLAVAVAVDRSGSMGEPAAPGLTKLAAALRALEEALRGLGPGGPGSDDLAAGIAFAREAEVVRPLGPLGDPGALVAALAARGTSGETDVFPALAAAIEAVRAAPAPRRHVLLLSDGRSEATPDPRAALEALVVPPEVTVSVVAVGRDADRALLAAIAAKGRGRFAEAAAGKERLAGVLAREIDPRRLPPTAEGPLALPGGGSLARAARIQAKPTARTLLSLEGVGPLLVEGEAGLGRAVAYASDDTGPCASAVAAALLAAIRPPGRPGATLSLRDDGARLAVEATLPAPTSDTASPGETVAVRISGRADLVPLEEFAPRRYRGAIERPARAVVVALVDTAGGRPLATAVHAPQRPLEHVPAPPDEALLGAIAQVTGGRLVAPGEGYPAPAPVLRSGRAPVGRVAVLAAMALLALEVALGAAAGAHGPSASGAKVLDKHPSISA